jgi:hypothetical protein
MSTAAIPEIKSKLHEVIEAVNQVPDYPGKKALALKMVQELDIDEGDKRKMLMIINYQAPNAYRLTQYLYNSMLKFEGLGSVAGHRN